MNRLPTETLAEIASQLKALLGKNIDPHKPRLAPYSTISRRWQEVIERQTFRRININTNTLPELTAILGSSTGAQRICSIRELDFHHLRDQVPSLAPTQHDELREQQRLADESFSENMRALFGLLKGWEERLAGDQYQLRLFLGTEYRQKEAGVPLPPSPTVDIVRPPRPADTPLDAQPGVYRRPMLVRPLPEPIVAPPPQIGMRYISEEMLPELTIVSSMILYNGHDIHPESLLQIISQMKCLVDFEGNIFEENVSLELTREYRKGMWLWLSLLGRVCVWCVFRGSSSDFLLSSSSVFAPFATIAQCIPVEIPVCGSRPAYFVFGAC